jgi:hypothetical protein
MLPVDFLRWASNDFSAVEVGVGEKRGPGSCGSTERDNTNAAYTGPDKKDHDPAEIQEVGEGGGVSDPLPPKHI